MAPRDGLKRGCMVWHRRAGKDSFAINLTDVKAHQRVGTYWHLLPTTIQSRRVVWNETDGQGRRIIDQAFPPEVRSKTHEHEMAIRLRNGSFWQLGGSDNYNSLVGSNVVGVVFSEWALCDPSAWDYIRPILVENGGWALFITTPRGRNHAWDLWERVKDSQRWFTSKLTVRDTAREDGTPVISEEDVESEREEGMSDEKVEQEFYCSFAAGVEGAYFSRALETAREDDRIGRVPWNKRVSVHLYFDLGIDDSTAVWFCQREGWMRKWFRYEEWQDVALADVFLVLADMPYRYGTINLPHDGKQRDKGTGRTLEDYANDAFDDQRSVVMVHPAYGVQPSIEAARALISQSWFDESGKARPIRREPGESDHVQGCDRGLQCLLNYQKIWDPKRKVYQQNPAHNWASHGADAYRLAGMDDIDEPIHEIGDAPSRPAVVSQVRGSIRYGGRQVA
jgi:hypothetical protein